MADGRLSVRVFDSGPGFDTHAEHGTGVGMENVRQRLRLMLGPTAELESGRSGGETVVGFRRAGGSKCVC